ncbi:MAG: family 1 glycosylhydrolase [bacterium]|nr:family 1 glycosylhydrolase [bacterium]
MQRSFRFGVATADHQCEAYTGHDDVRDVWERVRGLTPRGRATDFWNRYREDVDLAKGLGCSAFRLSLAWARLEPRPGQWDDEAFAHYRDVLQYMRDAGMATVVTLHHNTWPLHVQAAGNGAGMLDGGFPARVGAYAAQVARRLGDLIDYYVTLNEPNQLVYGYIKGFWMRAYPVPPGLEPFATSEQQMDAVLQLIPNLFRAHTRARKAILELRPTAKVGANPLVLGLPRWLQRLVDRNATHLKSPEGARRQAARLSQRSVLDGGAVDISIAQVTMTQARAEDVLFSEPYFVAHLAALHPAAASLPERLETWKGRAGVTVDTATASLAKGLFPAAAVECYPEASAAVGALREGKIDLVFDDDVVLRQHASGGLALTRLPGNDQPFAVAMALGSRALLNAVDRALRDVKERDPSLPQTQNRKTIAHVGKAPGDGADISAAARAVPDLDKSLRAIRKRGVLRVGVHPGIEGLCMPDGVGDYRGLEPDLARQIARLILDSGDPRVQFVPLSGKRRMSATRSFLRFVDSLRKAFAMFSTLLGTNWWDLGMAGKLPDFLCPPECVGSLDYVGLDYYWGTPSLWPGQLHRLAAAAECRYASAPVWPNVLDDILYEAQERFPGKPIIVIENGCVTSADGFSRAEYLSAHIRQVERAVERGVPIDAYLCWSITSNREWGLPFDDNSDFGLYHIDLDRDPNLTRVPTEASARYAEIIAPQDRERLHDVPTL